MPRIFAAAADVRRRDEEAVRHLAGQRQPQSGVLGVAADAGADALDRLGLVRAAADVHGRALIAALGEADEAQAVGFLRQLSEQRAVIARLVERAAL